MAAGECLLALWCCASVVLIADGVRLGDELKDVDEDSLSPAAAAHLLTHGIAPQVGPDDNPFGIRTKKRSEERGGLHKTHEKDEDADHKIAHPSGESLHQDHGSAQSSGESHHQDHGSSSRSKSDSSETGADFRKHISNAFGGGKNKGDGEGDGDQHDGGDDNENPDDEITDKPPDMQKDILEDPNYKNRHEIEFHKDMHGHINVHVDKRKIAENYWDLHGWEYRNGQRQATSKKRFRHGMEQS